MPDSAPTADPVRPPEWAPLLTLAEWKVATQVLGTERLTELHPLMSELTPSLRHAFVRHLPGLEGLAHGQAVILALARATDDPSACTGRLQSGHTEERRS
jgi:hypothetical protein